MDRYIEVGERAAQQQAGDVHRSRRVEEKHGNMHVGGCCVQHQAGIGKKGTRARVMGVCCSQQ